MARQWRAVAFEPAAVMRQSPFMGRHGPCMDGDSDPVTVESASLEGHVVHLASDSASMAIRSRASNGRDADVAVQSRALASRCGALAKDGRAWTRQQKSRIAAASSSSSERGGVGGQAALASADFGRLAKRAPSVSRKPSRPWLRPDTFSSA